MGSAVLLWTLALLSLPALITSDAHYMVVFPAIIHHPNTEKVCILIKSLPENVHLSVKLELEAQNHTLVEKDVEQPGIFECINFQGEEEALAHVYVLIQKDGSVRYAGRKKVLVKNRHPKDVVETDKPFYKPGETDPSGATDAYKSPVKEGQGSPSTPLKTETRDEEEMERHKSPVLPRRYTYGKPVQGNVNLALKRPISYIFEEAVNETLTDIEKTYTSQTDKTGCITFTIEGTDIHLLQQGYANYLTLSAEMEEQGTGLTNTETINISIAVKEMSLTFFALNRFYKKGFPYTGKLLVRILEVPVQNQTVYITVDVDDMQTHIPFVTDEYGIVNFSLDTTDWKDTLVSLWARYSLENTTQLEAAWRMRHEDLIWLKPFYSESNSFLEIQHVDEHLPCGKDQEILVDYILDYNELDPEADHIDFYFLVISKGRIVSSGQKQVPVGKDETLKGTFSLTLSTSSNMVPKAMLLLYAVFADGEVAADMETFNIDMCFKYEVMLDFSEEEELPGAKINLELEAAPGALCSVHAVDKSVILKKDETLTPKKLFYSGADDDGDDDKELITGRGFPYRLEDFEPYPCMAPQGAVRVAPWYQSEADVYSLLKEDILSLSQQLIAGCAPHHESNVVEKESQTLDSTEKKKDRKGKPRTCFPETWIWDLVPVSQKVSLKKRPTMHSCALQVWLDGIPCSGDPVVEEVSLQLPEDVVKDSGRATVSVIAGKEKHSAVACYGVTEDRVNLGGRTEMLKGGVDDDLSLTAYVTASLLELNLEKNGTIIDDALLCLKRNLSSMDIFTKALSAYVFALAGDSETRQQLLRELDEHLPVVSNNLKSYIYVAHDICIVLKGPFVLLTSVESTAFLILAYLSGPSVSPDDISYVSKLTKSAVLLQSALGGFGSTQATVVTTQALAKYAALAYREIEDLKVVVKSGKAFQHEFHVDKKNQLVLQQASLPEIPAQYKVEVSGNGCAYVQTYLRYNSQPPKPEAFALSVRTSPEECNEDSRRHFDLNVEVSYTGQRESSNMALIEVNMLSGYVPGKKTLKKLLMEPLVKKVEFENEKVIIYLDQLDNEVQSYTFSLKQEIEVSDLKAATVKVYDYYQPEDYAIVEYNAPCSTESGKKDHQ
ncbi:hypothetical protein JD844_010035 [Phrynosoma platyrhinos]|uniref:Alpha-2-macroglobulin n=1 Tax=Phrynosoma platyrhinos TaxID=52577 RepID=A0ABQ7TFY1_PHRPL|nr:hypothetical protein JD844_010035 [Phrynosoma platyrhinos]